MRRPMKNRLGSKMNNAFSVLVLLTNFKWYILDQQNSQEARRSSTSIDAKVYDSGTIQLHDGFDAEMKMGTCSLRHTLLIIIRYPIALFLLAI